MTLWGLEYLLLCTSDGRRSPTTNKAAQCRPRAHVGPTNFNGEKNDRVNNAWDDGVGGRLILDCYCGSTRLDLSRDFCGWRGIGAKTIIHHHYWTRRLSVSGRPPDNAGLALISALTAAAIPRAAEGPGPDFEHRTTLPSLLRGLTTSTVTSPGTSKWNMVIFLRPRLARWRYGERHGRRVGPCNEYVGRCTLPRAYPCSCGQMLRPKKASG